MPAFQSQSELAAAPNRSISYFDELVHQPRLLSDRLRVAKLLDASSWYLLPFGAVALAGPGALLAAAPTFLALVLEDEEMGDTRYRKHWAAVMLPLLGFAAASGLRRLRRVLDERFLLTLVLAGAAAAYVTQSPLPGGGTYRARSFQLNADKQRIAETVEVIPADIPLVVSAPFAVYLAQRPELYVFPPERHYTEGVSVAATRVRSLLLDLREGETRRELGESPQRWIAEHGAKVLFAPDVDCLYLADDFPVPTVPTLDAPEGGQLGLDGYDVTSSGDWIVLTLQWRVADRSHVDLARTIELVAADGRVVASEQRNPLLQIFPTSRWRPGQRIIDRVELRAAGMVGAPYTFRASWHAQPGPGEQDASPTIVGAIYHSAPLRPLGGVTLPRWWQQIPAT
jgi:hypothetical protein